MNITTKYIIKLLPFDDKFKDELLGSFDSLNDDKKYNIETILWDTYDAYYDMKLQENMELALLEMRVKGGELDSTFYQKMEEKTKKQLQEEFHKESTDVDLTQVREKLQAYIGNDGPSN